MIIFRAEKTGQVNSQKVQWLVQKEVVKTEFFLTFFRYQGTDVKIEQFQKHITTPLAFVMEILVIGTGKFQEYENINRIL